jgi:CxxC-x17-CxxC domain-containing protein
MVNRLYPAGDTWRMHYMQHVHGREGAPCDMHTGPHAGWSHVQQIHLYGQHFHDGVRIDPGYSTAPEKGAIQSFLCSDCEYNCTVLYCMSNTMFGSNNFGGSRNFGGPRDSGPREMTKVTCSDCGKECEVPFKPTEGRPVYCRDCLPKHRKPRF